MASNTQLGTALRRAATGIDTAGDHLRKDNVEAAGRELAAVAVALRQAATAANDG